MRSSLVCMSVVAPTSPSLSVSLQKVSVTMAQAAVHSKGVLLLVVLVMVSCSYGQGIN